MANFNINKVVLGGRLTADVVLRTTESGVSVCAFNIAVNRKANREKTDFISCVAWRNTAEFISKYFHKGSSICVTGEVQTRSWQNNNDETRYATEIIVDEAYFVDSKADNKQENTAATTEAGYYDLGNDEGVPF